MSLKNVILKNARIISPADGLDDAVDVEIENGIITRIERNIEGDGIDFSNKFIIPGLVDMHCHLREPGFEYKEDLESGIESALAGGFTAICPMANTNPVVDSVEVLERITAKAKGIGLHQICALTKNLEGKEPVDFEALKNAGAVAFSDDGKPLENFDIYIQALTSGNLIISHAEDSHLGGTPLSEAIAVARELEILRAVGGRLHFAHISTKRAIELIRQAKYDGLSVTCETAPHYFCFTKQDETSDGRFKMNPPLRTKEDVKAVIAGLKDGTIDCIATDHAPHSLEEKKKSFDESPFGIVGFETAFGAAFRYLVIEEHLTLAQLIEKMSTNPAKILGLSDIGTVKVGQRANLTVIDPYKEYKVEAKNFKTKCKISPFEGRKLQGKAVATVVDGEVKIHEGKLCKR